MALGVQIRRFELEDETDAVSLMVQNVAPENRERAYSARLARWKWQYYDNPNNPDGEALIWVATVDGSIAGMVATVPVKIKAPRGMCLGMWGVDFMVDGRMRGMGIGRKLLAEWVKAPGIKFVLGWRPVSFIVATRIGFKVVWGFSTNDIVLSPVRFALALKRESRRRDLLRYTRLFLRKGPVTGKGSYNIAVSDEIPSGTGRLWARISEAYKFSVHRDESYLRWRFSCHPTHSYRFISIGAPEDPSAVAVCRLTDEKPPLGIVSDLIVDPHCPQLVREIVDHALSFFRSEGAYAASLDLPPALAPQILNRHKRSLTRDLGMLICSHDKELESAGIFTPDEWCISRSDSDQDY